MFDISFCRNAILIFVCLLVISGTPIGLQAAPAPPPPPPVPDAHLLPDLAFTYIREQDPSGMWHQGQALINQGFVASSPFTIAVWVGEGPSLRRVDGLAPGQTITLYTGKVIPSCFAIALDYQHEVDELREDNNRLLSWSKAACGPPPFAP